MLKWFIFIFFLINFSFVKAQDLDWVKGFSADSSANVGRVEITPENDVISLGFARGKLHSIGDSGNSLYNSILIKHNSVGDELWEMVPIADTGFYFSGFKVDNSGNIYLIGEFYKKFILLNDTFTADSSAAFIAKYNSERELLWFYKSEEISFYDLRLSPENNVILHCFTKSGTANIGSSGGIEAFYLEYKRNFGFAYFTSAGELKWAKFYGEDSFYYSSGTPFWQVNKNGIYCLSYIYGDIDLETGLGKTIVKNKDSFFFYSNIILAKYSLAGNLEWFSDIIKESGGNGYFGIRHVNFDLDEAGNIILVGAYAGNTDFDFSSNEYNIKSHGRDWSSQFLAKYDSALNFKWAKNIGGSEEYFYWNRVAAKIYKESIFIFGLYSPGMDLDPSEEKCISPNVANHFFAEYNLNGNLLTARFLGGQDELYHNKEIFDFELDEHKNIYLCGVYDDDYRKFTFDFDPSEDSFFITSSSKYWSGFLAKYAHCKKPIKIIPQYKTTDCQERLTTLYAQNDHFPVRWYNESGKLLHEGIIYTLPQINSSTKITAEDGCGYKDEFTIDRQNRWVNIQKIYPNPVKDNLTISLEGIADNELNLQLINALGQIVYSGKDQITSGFQNIVLPVNGLKEGIYLLQLNSNCFHQTEKIIVVK